MPVDDLLARLKDFPPSEQRDSYEDFIREGGDSSLRREGGPEHVTASCFVFSPDRDHVLLCFHRKGRFWVQFGGHIEHDDVSVNAAAQREAREESGIRDLTLASPQIVDLDRHELHSGFSCAAHWDIGYAAIVSMDSRVAVSDESVDVRWFALDNLPADTPPRFETRVRRAMRATAQIAGQRDDSRQTSS
ncbi:NUDIX hydrolase [Microbacterium sp. NPDC057407]|uniref:NUDIX hydrolase n=1 Tax=Microbacterium sp. NPDC057407 TaxID=3346120 RepID=UPI00366CD553